MEENQRRANELLALAGQNPNTTHTEDPNENLIADFTYGRGVFADPMSLVAQNDLRRCKYHQLAAKELLDRANRDDNLTERRRLVDRAKYQMACTDRLLAKYQA